jgi:hypothetical protein
LESFPCIFGLQLSVYYFRGIMSRNERASHEFERSLEEVTLPMAVAWPVALNDVFPGRAWKRRCRYSRYSSKPCFEGTSYPDSLIRICVVYKYREVEVIAAVDKVSLRLEMITSTSHSFSFLVLRIQSFHVAAKVRRDWTAELMEAVPKSCSEGV